MIRIRRRSKAFKTATIAAAVTLLGLGAWAATIDWIGWTTRSHIYQTIDQVPRRDVAIVPGVGAPSNRVLSCLFERLAPALALYRAGKVRAILVSGIGTVKRDEVSTMVRWLTNRGVDPEHILSDPAGYRTLDTMQRASALLGVSSAIVATQQIHMPRTLFLARAAGIDAVGLVVPTLIPGTSDRLRTEAMKSALAVVDTYVIGTGPRFKDVHGARLSQGRPGLAQPAAFNFLTSAISAGMAASQVATRP